MGKSTENRLAETFKSLKRKTTSSEEKLDEVKKELRECLESDKPFLESYGLFQQYLDAVAAWAFSAGVEEGFTTCLELLKDELREEMEEVENAASA